MRRLLTLLTFVCLLFPALGSAQEQAPAGSPLLNFRTYSGLHGSFAPGTPNAFGIGGIFEPKYAFTEQLLVGLRIDGTALVGASVSDPQNVLATIRAVAAGLLKAEYAFLPGDVRPFVGLGGGWYTAVVLAGGSGGASALAGSGPGVMPQLGVDLGGFRIAAQYHYLFGFLNPASFLAAELSWRVF